MTDMVPLKEFLERWLQERELSQQRALDHAAEVLQRDLDALKERVGKLETAGVWVLVMFLLAVLAEVLRH